MTDPKKNKIISIQYDMTFDFSIDEVWPDGDAPDNPTVEDVWNVIRECGGPRKVLEDWDLIDLVDEHDVYVQVYGPGPLAELIATNGVHALIASVEKKEE